MSNGVIVSVQIGNISSSHADNEIVGKGPLYQLAGLSGGLVGEIVPNELYAGGGASPEDG